MKTVNLKSIIAIFKHLKIKTPEAKFLKFWDIEIKAIDLETLESLLLYIQEIDKKINTSIFDDFCVSYSIPQIGKEFDLLKLTEKEIINIELKSKKTEKIKKQLIKNKYYLNFLNKEMYLYTYIAEDKTILKLNNADELEQIDIKDLIKVIKRQSESKAITQNIDNLFKPSNYLISPFSKTKEFIENEYFLTKEQEEVEKNILNQIDEKKRVFLVTGSAGSGKTLLTYHIAKELQKSKKTVGIIHTGNLNAGHVKLKEDYNWNIQPIKFWKEIFEKQIPEILVIDEVQRANNKQQFKKIIECVRENEIILIMSGDKQQTLRDDEGWAIEWENINKYKLNEKIRTNKELSSFITVLLDLGRKHHIKISDKNINIVYFETLQEAKEYVLNKEKNNYTYISYTPNTGNYTTLCQMHRLNFSSTGTAHQVIGQEFENVITILDKNFYYNENNILCSNKVIHNPYSLRRMFFQQITRAINKLEIVVIENIELYNKIMGIFE